MKKLIRQKSSLGENSDIKNQLNSVQVVIMQYNEISIKISNSEGTVEFNPVD